MKSIGFVDKLIGNKRFDIYRVSKAYARQLFRYRLEEGWGISDDHLYEEILRAIDYRVKDREAKQRLKSEIDLIIKNAKVWSEFQLKGDIEYGWRFFEYEFLNALFNEKNTFKLIPKLIANYSHVFNYSNAPQIMTLHWIEEIYGFNPKAKKLGDGIAKLVVESVRKIKINR